MPPAERMRAHRRAAELLAVREDSAERVAEHLLATEPAGDAWTVARLTEAAREAARRGAPESAASYLRRVAGRAAAAGRARRRSCSSSAWPRRPPASREGEAHLREALDAAGDDDVRLGAALVLAHVLGRDERIAAAIEVIDLAAARLADGRGRARVLLESMATGAGMLDAATAPRLASRMRAMRRAADHAHVAARGPRRGGARRRRTPTSPRRPASRWRSGRSPRARGSSPSRPTCPGSRRRRSRSSGPTRTTRRRSRSTPAWPRAARPATPRCSA